MGAKQSTSNYLEQDEQESVTSGSTAPISVDTTTAIATTTTTTAAATTAPLVKTNSIIEENVDSTVKKFNKIKCIKSFNFSYKCLVRIAYLDIKKQIIISDCEDSSLKVIDLNGNYLGSFNPDSTLKSPWGICVNSKNEVFVADGQLECIFVFNFELNYQRQFGKSVILLAECLIIDEYDGENLLYAADYTNNVISVWYSETGKYKCKFLVNSPSDLAIMDDKLYVTSETSFSFEKNSRKLASINGENCIHIFNKKTFDYIGKVKTDNWLAPSCIFFDENRNLMTIAFHVDENKVASTKRHLYIIEKDSQSNCLKKLELEVDKTSDMCIIGKRIIFVRGPFSPPVYFIEF